MEFEGSKAVKELSKKGNRKYIIYAVLTGAIGITCLVASIVGRILEGISNEVYVVSIVGLLCIAVSIVFVIMIVKKKCLKHIKRYFKEHPDTAISEIDRDFAGANKVFKKLWIGDKCTYYVGQMYPNIIENNELIWVYLTNGSGTNGYWQLNFCERDTRMTKINIKSEKKAKGITQIYNEKFKHIVVGYSEELDDLFNSNLEKFLELKYNQNI